MAPTRGFRRVIVAIAVTIIAARFFVRQPSAESKPKPAPVRTPTVRGLQDPSRAGAAISSRSPVLQVRNDRWKSVRQQTTLGAGGPARRVDRDLRFHPAGGLTITRSLHDAAAGPGVGQAPAEGRERRRWSVSTVGAAATENSSSPGLRGYLLRAASGLYMPRPRQREAVSPGRLVQVNFTAS